MASTTRKFTAALGAASADKAFQAGNPYWQRMKRETLYARLEARGYMWDSELQVWMVKQTVTVRTKRALQEMKTMPVAATFHLRLLCPRTEADDIEGELFELAEALGWNISRPRREYDNEPGGSWVRRYYQIERKG